MRSHGCSAFTHTLPTGRGHLYCDKITLEAITQHIFVLCSHHYCLFSNNGGKVPMSAWKQVINLPDRAWVWFVKAYWCSREPGCTGNGPALNSGRKYEKSETSFWVSSACLSCSYSIWNMWISDPSEKTDELQGVETRVTPWSRAQLRLTGYATSGKLLNPFGYWLPRL